MDELKPMDRNKDLNVYFKITKYSVKKTIGYNSNENLKGVKKINTCKPNPYLSSLSIKIININKVCEGYTDLGRAPAKELKS